MTGIALIRKPGVATAMVFLNYLLMQLLYSGTGISILMWPYGILQGLFVDLYFVLRGGRVFASGSGVRHRRKRRQSLPFSLDQLLKITDLTDYRKANPFYLSFGQRKRLALGALLTRLPALLILDEPTTGQDEGHARAFLQFLQELRESQHLTYVMITHDMRAVARYANRVIVLNDGRVLLDDKPEIVFAHVDELAQSGILPPPIAQLHARLCDGQALRVALSVDDFLHLLQPVEVTP